MVVKLRTHSPSLESQRQRRFYGFSISSHCFTSHDLNVGAARRRYGISTLSWTETVRCGNDGVQPIIEENGSPYAGLIGATLTSRLTIARQMDDGSIPEEEGKAKLATINTQIRALPGSMMDLLSMTATAGLR